jgi:hypothetical protein
MTLPVDLAVFAEYSPSMKVVQGGWNARVFNKTEVLEGSSIRANTDTGVVTLGPGVYHITGFSTVTYNSLDPSEKGRVDIDAHPYAGYCRLRYAKDVGCLNELAIAIGSVANANMLPSSIDTYLDVPRQAEIVLEHQIGDVVSGVYLEDNSGNSPWHVFARIAIRRVLKTSTQYQRSSLARVFDAAFATYLASAQSYRHLYGTYLGTEAKFVPTVDDGSWVSASDATLSRVLKSGVLRFGYVDGVAPYVYRGDAPSAELRGLDWELGNALTAIIRDQYFSYATGRGLRAEWIKVDVQSGGDPEAAKFDALHDGLQRGLFDIAMSGQANISTDLTSSAGTREVDWTAPTALLFTNILYSGRGGYDLSALVGSTRDRFIEVVKGWPDVKIMCVKNPGPSSTNSAALVDSINAVGGHATLDNTGTLPSITKAIADQIIHFSVGDPVASSWIGNQPGFKGLNLDIAAATKPLQTAQQVAAFTLSS